MFLRLASFTAVVFLASPSLSLWERLRAAVSSWGGSKATLIQSAPAAPTQPIRPVLPNATIAESHYERLWRTMEPVGGKGEEAAWISDRLLSARGRYDAAGSPANVPWFIVGVVHNMEAGLRFDRHLHNGDSLQARTVQAPKGRPEKGSPPFVWEVSAADALRYDNLHKVGAWDIHRTLASLERYNGLGYQKYHPEINTPYLWSGTNHYSKGKYVRDGKYDPNAVSQQTGAAVILWALSQRGEIVLHTASASGKH